MSNAVLDQLREERDEARAAAVALAESDNFNPEDETYVGLKTRAEALDGRITELTSLMEARKNSDALDGKLSKFEKRATQSGGEPESRGSWGDIFTRSEQFTGYSRHGQSAKLEVEAGVGSAIVQSRALPTGLGTLDTAGLDLGKTTVNTTAPTTPTPLLDSVAQIQVSGNSVEYVAWDKVAGGAAIVPEGALKPSAEFGPSVTSATLDMVAVYTQLTRQLIEDAPAVRSLIDGELRRDVANTEEANVATALANAILPVSQYALGSDAMLEQIRIGMGVVQTAGYTPNAVLLNPADWAKLDVDVMGGTLNGPVVGQRFFGLTPIPSAAQAEGTAIVGDFSTAVNFFFRSGISLFITDSHADTFTSNIFTLLAERRSLAAVVRPAALVEISEAAA